MKNLFKFSLYNEEINRIKMSNFVVLFIFVLSLIVVPFNYQFMKNFSYEHVDENSTIDENFDFAEINELMSEVTVTDYELSGDSEAFSYTEGEQTVALINKIYVPEEYGSLNGLYFFKNVVIFTDEALGLNLFFTYPETMDFNEAIDNSSADNEFEQLLSTFYYYGYCANALQIMIIALASFVLYRVIFLLGIMLISMVVKLVPTFRSFKLSFSFKIVTFSLVWPSIIYFVCSFIFDDLLTLNVIFNSVVAMLVIANILALYIRNSKDRKARLDSQKYL